MQYQPFTKRAYGSSVTTTSPGATNRGITRPPKAKGNAQQPRS